MLKKLFDKLVFTPEPIQCYSIGMTDVGQYRTHNEDSYLTDEQLGLFIVADGMGGHEAGEIASKLTIDTIFKHINSLNKSYQKTQLTHTDNSKIINQLVQNAIEDANKQTHYYNATNGKKKGRGMGTTVTGFLTSALHIPGEKKLHTFNVGDSRIYCFAQNKLTQLTTDHSHYQLWLDTGKEGPAPRHSVIYKAIGPWDQISVEQHIYSLKGNELFLLCSDGLSDMLPNQQIQYILYQHKNNSLKQTAQALIHAANTAGGKDNITVVLVKP
jgi:protein phosphatase